MTEQPQLITDGVGTRPCGTCNATHPNHCTYCYMHCTAPQVDHAPRTVSYCKEGNYWRWSWSLWTKDEE